MNVSNLPIIAILLVFGPMLALVDCSQKSSRTNPTLRGNPNTLYTEIGMIE
jgi:hypothetical protein